MLRARTVDERGFPRIADAAKPVYVFFRTRPASDQGEIRGEFWDLGRLAPGDPRFAGQDFTALLEQTTGGRWPTRDQVFVLLNASLLASEPPRAPTIREIALSPDQYVDREVRVIGRFKGRNLYAELPLAIGKSKWDFVVQSADGAIWVANLRPRGKGFELNPERRVDTGQWVEVRGVVRREGVTTYIDGTSIALASEPEETTVEIELPERPAQPPPQVVFSAPVGDDTDVDRSAPVRVQFSRDMDPRSIRDRVRVTYVDPAGAARVPSPESRVPSPESRVPAYSVTYNDGAHAIEIRFAEPLERFQRVKIEILEGMTALDGQPLKPWSFTFTTGR